MSYETRLFKFCNGNESGVVFVVVLYEMVRCTMIFVVFAFVGVVFVSK